MAFCYIYIYGLVKTTAYGVMLYMHIRDFYKKLNRICIYTVAHIRSKIKIRICIYSNAHIRDFLWGRICIYTVAHIRW